MRVDGFLSILILFILSVNIPLIRNDHMGRVSKGNCNLIKYIIITKTGYNTLSNVVIILLVDHTNFPIAL